MFSKNLKFYRLSKQMSKKELADKANVTSMAITNYEKGARKPGMEILQALAAALEIRVSDFLQVRNENITFEYDGVQKVSSLSNTRQEYIRESAEEYFSRFMTAVELLGGEVLPDAPACHVIQLSQDPEKNAAALRAHLGFAADGPIEDLTGMLENKGILVYEGDVDDERFSGMNGFVNGRPFIVLNSGMNAERNRSAVVNELARLMFKWPADTGENDTEKMSSAVEGAFLFPAADVRRELGIHRSAVTPDMVPIAMKYGISVMLLVKRAEISHIITASAAKNFYIKAAKAGWKTNEPSRIKKEKAALFVKLVYRAVNEDEISVQHGAELLKVPLDTVLSMQRFSEIF